MINSNIITVIMMLIVLSSLLSSSLSYNRLLPSSSRSSRYRLIKSLSSSSDVEIKDDIQISNSLNDDDKGIPITWTASVKSSAKVKEQKRTTEEYMRLPASEYSVLSAEQIIRLNDNQFKCVLPTMNFFGEKITPVLYVDVTIYPDEARSEILVNRAETIGSDTADKVNGTFSIRAMNEVSTGLDYKGRKVLNSCTNLKIDVLIPKESKVPRRLLQSGGNFIMQSSLNIIVPTFIRLLAFDFNRWSQGDDSRSAVEGASISL